VIFLKTFGESFVKLTERALGKLLTGLKEVRVVGNKQKYRGERAIVRANLDICVRDLRKMFKALKNENPERNLPVVKSLDWYEVS
jgi:hypothetical protein